jgi:hypothetical protein
LKNIYNNMKHLNFIAFVAFFITINIALHAQQSTLVYPGTDGKLVYTPHANNGETNNVNILPDFSYAGYMNGGVKLPVGEVPVKVTLYPTASGQDRTRIQAAIDQVCTMTPDANGFRGAVLLKKGTYRLNDGTIPNLTDGYGSALRIWASGVVLRGEGQGPTGTVLYSDFAVNHTMITIEPQSKGASETNVQRITDDYVGTGANSFTVASTSGYTVGDWIMVRFTPNDTWFSDLKVTTGGFINDPADYWTVAGEREAYRLGFKRKITAINGNTITIDCPLVQPLQTKYGGGQIARLTTSGRLSKCGVEDLRMVGIEDGGSPSVSGNGNRLRVGIRPRYIENSWIHGVTVCRTSEAGVMTWDVMNLTVEECAYIDPRGSISGGWRYSFCLDAQSTRVLFQRCYSDYGRHDFVTHARIPGPNVFLDCVSIHGLNLLGPHHRWATGTLFDNIKSNSTMAITEYATGSAGHAFCGAQTVGWNLECGAYICDAALGSQNYLIGSIGNEAHGAISHDAKPGSIFRGFWERSGPSGSHVAVRSLYLKQLEDRLGTSAIQNITIPAQRTGNIYAKLAAWAGNGSFYSENIAVEDIAIAPSNPTVNLKNTIQLYADITPWDASNRTVTWSSDNPAVASVNTEGTVTGESLGSATISAKTADGQKLATTTVNVILPPVSKIISNCESTSAWTSSNTLTLNSSDKKEGNASLQSAGSKTDEFKLVLSTPINTGANTETDKLQFWYFVSDVSLFSTNNQVELGSGGAPDINEYSWNIGTLVNGWNLISLPLKNAGIIGTPDLSAINWFRIYHVKTGSITTKIDQISIETNSDPNAVKNPTQTKVYAFQNYTNSNTLTLVCNATLNNPQIKITNLQGQTVYQNKFQSTNSFDINTSGISGGKVFVLEIKSADFYHTQKIIL